MANEIIELPQRAGNNMPVTREDVETLKHQRALLIEFVNSQLKEGIDNDYAVIPGTKKKSLLKPGAEKLARLFGLGVRVRLVDKELDRTDNFAMYTYRAEVYQISNPGVVISECEASCNSQEKKYKERTTWEETGETYDDGRPKKERVVEPTPVCDILNTLQKMAQKRAIVGSVILAVSGSDFFTQDIEDADDAKTLGLKPKAEPKRAAASVPKATSAKSSDVSGDPASYVIPFGNQKGQKLGSLPEDELANLNQWLQGIDNPRGSAAMCKTMVERFLSERQNVK